MTPKTNKGFVPGAMLLVWEEGATLGGGFFRRGVAGVGEEDGCACRNGAA
jgi:hypothetical protein